MNLYGLYENGTLVFKGTSKQIAEKCDVLTKDVTTYAGRGTRMCGRWIVKKEGKYVLPPKEKVARSAYGLYEGDKLVDIGSGRKLAEKYGTTLYELTNHAYKDSKYLGKYLVRKVERTSEDKVEIQKRTTSKKFEENLKNLLTNLKIYGNTSFVGNIDEYISELKKNGYEPKITLKIDTNLKGRKEKWWLIETRY